MKDIAKAAEVSVATVSNVLNGKANVGPETREKVLRICKEMNYHPNILARNLKTGRTNTVMFVFSDFERNFYLKIINGINDCLLEHRTGLIICTHTTIENFLQNGFVDGAIVLDKRTKDSQLLAAAGPGMKIVVMDRVLDSPHISCVVTDNADGMTQLVESLVEKGYRTFGYVGGPEFTLDHAERYRAFREVLRRRGIPFSRTRYYHGDFSLPSGARAGKLMAMGGQLPDAVVCANDDMAAGVVLAFRELGVAVPGQVAVTGFDGDPMTELPGGVLTTVDIPRYEMGYLAAETLVRMIDRDAPPLTRKIKAPVCWGRTSR